jgi:hypothetical protein
MLDKKLLWKMAVDLLEAELGPALFHMLRDGCYLDSVEDGVAIVAAETEHMRDFYRKRSAQPLKEAFSKLLKRPVTVKFAVGHPRIIENKPKSPPSSQQSHPQTNDAELALLHERYGDIMGIVDHHPVFKKASMPVDKGGWGIFPQLLTNACKDYGVMPVLNGLRFVANRPSVVNPRAFFFTALRKGQFGHRLAVGAKIL